ncbi:MAG: tRNA 4-thiouridine(8) synthase ThiI [Syntrophomonadaceae bacterium]|nr:tRNA 4-thiouridine(8) synthase ThiI [Syntrophomonadaceae bacterium]
MKAISLFSGGLDSQLAVAVIQKQGITVEGVNFTSPFFGADERNQNAARHLGIKLHLLPVGEEYITQVLRNPKYGYGKNMNPCIDCHAFMIRKAGDFMPEIGASFIITGEVLGQRPMSQNKSSLMSVEKLSGYRGYIVRPLSGKLLPATIPEQEGWIEREKLLDISGRGRTRQIQLAEELGIQEYPSPAGGCLLTEANFARRLRVIMDYKEIPSQPELELLKTGRHFFLNGAVLLVVGRNQSENELIEILFHSNDILLKVTDRPGPTALLRPLGNELSSSIIEYAAALVARYSDAKNEATARVKSYSPADGIISIMEVKPLAPHEVPPAV